MGMYFDTTSTYRELHSERHDQLNQMQRSTLWLMTSDDACSTGIILTEDGLVVTTAHSIQGNSGTITGAILSYLPATSNPECIEATPVDLEVLWSSSKDDIAFARMHVSKRAPDFQISPVCRGSFAAIPKHEDAFTVGYVGGNLAAITATRLMPIKRYDAPLPPHLADKGIVMGKIYPGQSGSGVFVEGKCVGILSSTTRSGMPTTAIVKMETIEARINILANLRGQPQKNYG